MNYPFLSRKWHFAQSHSIYRKSLWDSLALKVCGLVSHRSSQHEFFGARFLIKRTCYLLKSLLSHAIMFPAIWWLLYTKARALIFWLHSGNVAVVCRQCGKECVFALLKEGAVLGVLARARPPVWCPLFTHISDRKVGVRLWNASRRQTRVL